MLFYILYKLGFLVANILPLKTAYWLAERISDIQYNLARKDRDAVLQNLSILLKKDMDECRLLARKVFRNFGLYLVDFFRIGRLNKEIIKKKVELVGIENLEEVLQKGKGIIALTGHIGNWEMGGVVVAIMGYNISAVALNHKYKDINNFFIRQRERRGLKVIQMKSMMRACITALLEKRILALLGDRDFTRSGIILDFFGIPTSIPKGPAILSLKTGSPIVPSFFVRVDRYNYRLIFDKPIEVQNKPGVEESEIIKEATKSLVVVMENYIKEYVEQWLLFRRFWELPVDAVVI